MATLPQFKQRQLARRTSSDLDRLAAQFRSGVDSITTKYQKAFGTYQQTVAEKMAPFEAAVANYQTKDMPAYEEALAKYRKQLDAYNAQIKDIEANPYQSFKYRVEYGKQGTLYKEATTGKLVDDFLSSVTSDRYGDLPQIPGQGAYDKATKTYTAYYTRKVPEAFTEKAPAAPQAPQAPDIGAFDSSAFESKKAELQSAFTREVGERRAAKLGAVGRRSARPMLQGA